MGFCMGELLRIGASKKAGLSEAGAAAREFH